VSHIAKRQLSGQKNRDFAKKMVLTWILFSEETAWQFWLDHQNDQFKPF